MSALTTVRRVIMGMWLTISAVLLTIWVLISVVRGELVAPFWIWSVGGGAVLLGALWRVMAWRGRVR